MHLRDSEIEDAWSAGNAAGEGFDPDEYGLPHSPSRTTSGGFACYHDRSADLWIIVADSHGPWAVVLTW
jgi:hypothetical protein